MKAADSRTLAGLCMSVEAVKNPKPARRRGEEEEEEEPGCGGGVVPSSLVFTIYII